MTRTLSTAQIEQALLREGIDMCTVAAFLEYHKKYPRIWCYFALYAKEILEAGGKVGCRCVMERVRWEITRENLKVAKKEHFKVDNVWTPYYGRVFLMFFPKYAQVFRLRKARGVRRFASRRGEQKVLKFKRAA